MNPMITKAWEALHHVLAKVERPAEYDPEGAKYWTRRVKKALHTIYIDGQANRTFMAAGEVGPEPEYLVDVAVSEDVPGDDSDLGYRRLLFAAEVEWNPKQVELDYDFAKLADVRADLKVFVGGFGRRDWGRAETEVIGRFAAFVGRHKLVPPGEQFLVVLSGYGILEKKPPYAKAWIITRLLDGVEHRRLEAPSA